MEQKLIKGIPIGYYSMKILKEPEGKNKGAVILSQIDNVVEIMPFIKDKFYLIERRGWRGLNSAENADIKLVEDLSYWDETKKKFPNAICLDIGPADFVDTDSFKPLGVKKEYAGIQISQWAKFKRIEIFIQAAGLLPDKPFIGLGHFVDGGNEDEIKYKDSLIVLSRKIGANINYPYEKVKENKSFPKTKDQINEYINKASMGILTTKIEGINRFKMECLSAGIPVLIPNDACFPTKKHINPQTGVLFEPTPEGLAKAINEVLQKIYEFNPREYILKNTGKKRSLEKLKFALKRICKKDKVFYRFEDIDWDGRNQSLIWGERVFQELKKYY